MAKAIGLTSADDVAPAIAAMKQRLGIPNGLEALGVRSDQFAQIIQGALNDHCHLMYPRIAKASDSENMLYESM